MEKRVVFRHKTLPYLLLLPQVAVTLIFFFLPAGQALWQAFHLEDPFGLSSHCVVLDSSLALCPIHEYVESFIVITVSSVLVEVLGVCMSLRLAVIADRVVRDASVYTALLIWPYAVCIAIACVPWLFLW